jgi:hypothetical protein
MTHIRESKKSQITVFVIIAIIIVAVIAVIFFYPNIRGWLAPTLADIMPNACLQESVKGILNETLTKGGLMKPELYFMYENETIGYVCYTSEWYKTCIMQTPMLKQTVESEVQKNSQAQISSCISDMKRNLERRGYSLKTSGSESAIINIIPKKIIISLDLALALEKGGQTRTIPSSSLQTEINSNAYEMIMVASSIQNWEARYGDAVPESYMAFYPNLKVEKKKQDDGTKIYIITDLDTGEKLQFATRSLAWPPGLALPPANTTA